MIIDVESDRFVKEVIEGNEYSFAFKDLVVVDIGCNIGTFSFWIYNLAKEIHAIDMVPSNIASLDKSIAENKLDKIKTYCIAITGNTIPRKYVKDPVLGGGGSEIKNTIIHEEDSITQCTTLGQFMETNNIPYVNLLKMDVEGMEREIIGAGDFPFKRINTIIGELHSDGRNGRYEVQEFFVANGFTYSEPIGNHFLARRK